MKSDILERKDIQKLVDCFYDKVQVDEFIGSYFTEVVEVDWKHRLPQMYDFWESIRKIMAMQTRTTTTMDIKTGGSINLRKTSRATPEQAVIYRTLGISPNPCGLVKSYVNLPAKITDLG